MTKSKLKQVLYISNPKTETIYGVIGRMEVMLEFFRKSHKYQGLIPFLETYYLITRAVAERSVQHKNFFKDQKQLECLDVIFASLYFQPLYQFLKTKHCVKPWQTYFRYCQEKNGIPFLQMLLGINTHINADLFSAVVMLDYNNRRDFLKINQVLEEEIPNVMKFLAFEDHDLFGISALIFRKFVTQEFKKIIAKWRLQVSKNADKANRKNLSQYQKFLFRESENVGEQLITIFQNAVHAKQLPIFTSKLHSLKVAL